MIKALKEGYFIATLVDQNTRVRDGGVFVDFFGLPATTSRAPAMFARKLNVPIAVGGLIRQGRRYRVFTVELPKATGDYADDQELVQDIIRITEELIRQYPDQYRWMYERWRYIPEDIDPEREKRYPPYAEKVTPRFFSYQAPKDK